jgi:LysM repeat protein
MCGKAFTFILIISILAGCRVYKPAATRTIPAEPAARAYIDKYKDLAIREMMRTGVPASITLAQGMLESDFGRSLLAREANNHFGIKCHNGWKGPSMVYDDDTKDECFRKYRNPEESFQDHSDFLKNGSRYKELFKISPNDYHAWAHGLKKAGYATNPDYANLLIRKIEENGLAELVVGNQPKKSFIASSNSRRNYSAEDTAGPKAMVTETTDTERPARPPVFSNNLAVHAVAQRIMENNSVEYIIVKTGDKIEDIEKDFGLLSWELKKYNDIDGELRLVPGQVLYIQPKKKKAEAGKYYHTCAAGETMYSISQKYAVRLSQLYSMNRMKEGVEIHPGQRLWLRMTKPKS